MFTMDSSGVIISLQCIVSQRQFIEVFLVYIDEVIKFNGPFSQNCHIKGLKREVKRDITCF